MKQIKMIFFDIDGTLVNPQTRSISEKTIDTLKRLKQNGIKICIATGRGPVALPDFADVQFDAYITYNGSLCYDKSNTIWSNSISKDDLEKIIQNTANIGLPVAIATRERLAANAWGQDLADYFTLANLTLEVAEDFDIVRTETIYQVMVGCREKDFEEILRGVLGARIAVSWDRAVDVIPANGSKAEGIQKVLEYFNIDRAEALAFGDGNNDIEMLQLVGTGVAMGNASERLKEVADEVCGAVSEDGIYDYCIKYGLI